MTETITRLYESDVAAERAVKSLQAAKTGYRWDVPPAASRSWSMGDLAVAVFGAFAIVIALVLLAIPGFGALVLGAIVGALIQRATAETVLEVRSEKIRAGAVLVTARVPDRDRRRLEAMLDRTAAGARNLRLPLRKAG